MASSAKRKKLTLTLKMKNEIIQRIDDGENYSQISRAFGVGRSTVYDIYKNRQNIQKAAKSPHKLQRKTLRAGENPELEEKLYQWYLDERNLYPMTGSLIILKARTIHKEMTGKDDFLASTGWLDRFKKRRGIVLGSINKACSSRPITPPPPREPKLLPSKPASQPIPASQPTAVEAPPTDDVANIKTEKKEQLVIKVTNKMGSKTNVCNRFTINDGHFENVIVKEEMMDRYREEEEEPAEEEEEQEQEMFPQPEAILGNTDEIMEEKNSVLMDLNETLRKFLAEYKIRNALMRERIDLERARLQFDMEVYRNRQMEKRVIAVNANAMNAKNTGNLNTITVGANIGANVGPNVFTVANANASTANVNPNVITVTSANAINASNASNAGSVITLDATNATKTVKPNPVITINPSNTDNIKDSVKTDDENAENAAEADDNADDDANDDDEEEDEEEEETAMDET